MSTEDDSIERAIAGALRGAIKEHGPITPDKIGSAVKRIVGNLRNARATGLAAALGRRRWAGVDEEERTESMAALAKGRWANMTPEERSAEMKRRRRKGLKKAAEK
jgi:hypothetical protein